MATTQLAARVKFERLRRWASTGLAVLAAVLWVWLIGNGAEATEYGMWIVDLRWATIVLGACALAASSVAPGKGPFVLAVAGLWLGLDWLLRAEVLSGVTAVFAAMLAAAVLTAAIAIASRQPTIEPAIYRTAALPVVAGVVAALSAPAIVLSSPDGSTVVPPTSVTVIAAALPTLLAAVALLCGLSAALRGPGPVYVSRRFIWLAAVGTATLSVTAVASNGTAWAGLALPTGVLLAVLALVLAGAGRGPRRLTPPTTITVVARLSFLAMVTVAVSVLTIVLATVTTPILRQLLMPGTKDGLAAVPTTVLLALVLSGFVWKRTTAGGPETR